MDGVESLSTKHHVMKSDVEEGERARDNEETDHFGNSRALI